MTSGAWSSDSTIGLYDFGTLQNSRAVTVHAIGLGILLIIILGGNNIGPPASQTDDYSRHMPLSNITIYDPHIGVWFYQTATGTIPSPRGLFCAVSIPGDNGTYEIFIHGGQEGWGLRPYDEVYILSVPGFVWTKANYTPRSPRMYHTCEIIGKRQLVTIGGLDQPSSYNITEVWDLPDPLTQGIGIFDMTDMVWKDSYDANASDYQTPELVKDWYAAGNQKDLKWQSKKVAGMFIPDGVVSVNPALAYIVPSPSLSTSSNYHLGLSDRITLGTSIGFGAPGLVFTVIGVYLTWRHFKNKAKKGKAHHGKIHSSGNSLGANMSPNPGPTNSSPSNNSVQGPNTASVVNEGNARTSTRNLQPHIDGNDVLVGMMRRLSQRQLSGPWRRTTSI